MNKVKLGTVLKEEKAKIGKPDGAGLDLIGVSNEVGLQVSRAQRIADLSRYKIIRIGWFAYNPMRVNVGSIGIAQGPHHEGIVSPDYVVFSCSEKILPDYLLFFLKSDIGLEAINKNASGAVRKRLYFSDLARIELHVPSIEKQIEILESVKKIESMVTQLRDPERIGKVSQLKQSILQEAIQGKLTAKWRAKRQADGIETEPASELLKRIQAEKLRAGEKKIKKEKPLSPITEEEMPFELPEGWEWCRLGEICSVVRGGSPRPAGDPKFYGGKIPFLKVADLTGYDEVYCEKYTYTIKEAGLKKTRFVEANTLMLTNSGATLGIPRICRFATTFNDGIAAFLGIENLNKVYLYYFLLSKTDFYLKEASRGQGQPNLNTDIISDTIIALPSLEEQKAIVKKVESLMEKCWALEQEISQSEQHAQMLMQAVLKEAFEN